MKYNLDNCKLITVLYNNKEYTFGIKIHTYGESSLYNMSVNLYSYYKLNFSTEEISAIISKSFFTEGCNKYIVCIPAMSKKRYIHILLNVKNLSKIIESYLKLETAFIYGNKLLNEKSLNAFKNFKLYDCIDRYDIDFMFALLCKDFFALFINDNLVDTDCKMTSISSHFNKKLKYNRIGIYFK